MTRGDQFRPGPPPGLTSDTWKRDLDEIKALGGINSSKRTPEQTAIARFWEATAPAVYWPVARSVATAPGRDVTDNARLLALAAMAMDDALIAVFDAKYTFNFWRPVTAIRNGEGDTRDPGWTPFIATPMHPEYPCAHCIVSASLGAVLRAEIGTGLAPKLSSSSSTAAGAVRTWATSVTSCRRSQWRASTTACTTATHGGWQRNGPESGRARGEERPGCGETCNSPQHGSRPGRMCASAPRVSPERSLLRKPIRQPPPTLVPASGRDREDGRSRRPAAAPSRTPTACW